jgi:hypothetical protein
VERQGIGDVLIREEMFGSDCSVATCSVTVVLYILSLQFKNPF